MDTAISNSLYQYLPTNKKNPHNYVNNKKTKVKPPETNSSSIPFYVFAGED